MRRKNRKPVFAFLLPRQEITFPDPLLPGESPIAFSGRDDFLRINTDEQGYVTLINESDSVLPYVFVVASKTATNLIKAWPFVKQMPVSEALALAIGKVLSTTTGGNK